MGIGASSQSRKHPRSLAAGFAFNKPAEKIIYWQIKGFQTKPLPSGNGWCFPALLAKRMSRKSKMRKRVPRPAAAS